MKIRIRNYELVFVSLLVGITLIRYLAESFIISNEEIQERFAHTFSQNGLTFNYFTNVLSPRLGSLIFIYLLYLSTYLLNIPQIIISKKTQKSQYIWIAVYILIITFLLALSINAATYFARPAFFSYGGYKILAMFGYNDKPLEDLFFGFSRAFMIVSIYLVYTCLREYMIARIQKSTRRNYLSLIANQVSLIFIIYIIVPFFSATFELINDDFFYTVYVLFLTPTLLVYLTNTYWIFPDTDSKPWLNIRTLSILVLSTFIYTFFFSWLPHNAFSLPLWLSIWAIQLFIVSPITWLFYQQRKDKILQLRGTEKALTKSKADLQFLRSQINPHFLFNALNTLYGTALIDGSQRTAEGIQKLGDMMRFMLYDNHQDFIPMNSEINYLKNYISLQKLRIQQSPNIMIEELINDQNCNHVIMPMLLIPFVENAFKHGIHSNQKSWIKVNLNCDKSTIRFEVRNSVHPTQMNDPEREHTGIGLENVKERLHLFYPDRHQLQYGSDGKEFIATLVLQTGE
ncbi:sensor histidine kinase [Emticicia fontis]